MSFSAILFTIFLNYQAARAESMPFMISCATIPKATSSVVIKNEKSTIKFQYHQASTSAASKQIHFGSVLSDQFETLSQYKAFSELIGNDIQLELKAENCKYFGRQIFRCTNYDAKPLEVNGHQIELNSIFSEALISVSAHGQHVSRNIYLNFKIDDKDFTLPITYESDGCSEVKTEADILPKRQFKPSANKREA